MNYTFWYFMICMCLSVSMVNGQNRLLDSLTAEIDKTTDAKTRAELYLDLANEVLGNSVDKSFAATEKALAISRKLKDRDLEGRCLIFMGRTLGEKNALDSALLCFDQAEAIFSDPVDEFELAKVFNGKGIIFRYKNELESAIAHQFRSAELSEKTGNLSTAATTYNSIANIYTGLNNLPKAVEFYEKTIAILELGDNERALAGSLLNLANILDDNPERQFKLYDRAEKIALRNQYHRVLAYLYAGKGEYYDDTFVQPDSAKFYYRKAIEYAERVGDVYIRAYNELYLGLQEAQDKPELAISLLRRSLASEYIQNSDKHLRAEANFYLSKSLSQIGQHREAYARLDTALTLYKEVYDEDISSQLTEANAKYETSKKEAQLVEQQLTIAQQQNRQSRIIIIGLALLALLAAVFQYFFHRQRRNKQAVELALKNEQTEAERLKQLDEMKTRFFTDVSHELRTPLTLIISPLEEVLRNLKQVNLEADLQRAHRNSKNLLGLVNEVLDLSKMEVGKLDVEKTEMDLIPWLRRVLFSFESVANLKGVVLDFSCDLKDGLIVKTDFVKLEKVLNNLVSNALKFSNKKDTVKLDADIVTDASQSSLKLSVTDSGPGIHPDELPRIFDRFFQSKKSPVAAGTGVGLALSKQLVQLLNGELTVQSKPGEGSCFTLIMPCELVAVDKRRPESEMKTEEPLAEDSGYEPVFLNSKKPRLLIVEDNPEMGDYLKKSLSRNYECTLATDGEAALELLRFPSVQEARKGTYDLITSDVMMPNMDGFTFREKINEHSNWRSIPFILLTARTLEADKLKGFQLGIDDYITKPFSLPELEARILNLLRNKRLRDEMTEKDSPATEELSSPDPDKELLQEAEKLVLENMDDTAFSVEVLAKKLGYSQRQLGRTFGKLAGLTPVQFILELRLQRARQLLENRQFSGVNEIRYEIGIESASYFTRKFTERFGKNPSKYLD